MGKSSFITNFSMFKNKPPKQFHLPTRYYDADKEELDSRVKMALKESGQLNPTEYDYKNTERKIKFQSKINDKWAANNYQQGTKKANFRVFVILIIICFVGYFIFAENAHFNQIFNTFKR